MCFQHAMIQILAVQDQVIVAILNNDCIVGLNCTEFTPTQWGIVNEFTCTQPGAIRLINGITPYSGEKSFCPVAITQKDFDAIDEAKIAYKLGGWLEQPNYQLPNKKSPEGD